jgi:hypothetical protein
MKVKDLKEVFIKGNSGTRGIKFDIVSDWPDAPSELKDYSDECEVVDARCVWTFSGFVITIRISYMDSIDDIIKGVDNKITELQNKKVELERAFYQTSK